MVFLPDIHYRKEKRVAATKSNSFIVFKIRKLLDGSACFLPFGIEKEEEQLSKTTL